MLDIFIAAKNGNAKKVKYFLNKGSDPKNTKDNGETALHIASWEGHQEVVKLLLEAGSLVNKKSKAGWTPLQMASLRGNEKVVKLLLEYGADPNLTSRWCRSPLHWASQTGHLKVVKVLLAKGADPFKTIKYGKFNHTPLNVANDSYASDKVKKEIKKILKKAMGLNMRWRNMNNNQRDALKPTLIKKMIEKNRSKKTFEDPITLTNYNLKTLKPLNDGIKLGGLGLVIDHKNKPVRFVDSKTWKKSFRDNGTIYGLHQKNWSLINVTPKEYFKARKNVM